MVGDGGMVGEDIREYCRDATFPTFFLTGFPTFW